jgi:hypothetical protein
MLSARISPYTYVDGIQNKHLKNAKTDVHACKELRVWSGCASVPDLYAQCARKSRSMRVRKSIFSIIYKVPKTVKNFNKRSQNLHAKVAQTQKNPPSK